MGYDDSRDEHGHGRSGSCSIAYHCAETTTYCILAARFLDPSVILLPATNLYDVPSVTVKLTHMQVAQDVLQDWSIIALEFTSRQRTDEEQQRYKAANDEIIRLVRDARERAGWRVCQTCHEFGCTDSGWLGMQPCPAWSEDKQPPVSIETGPLGERLAELRRIEIAVHKACLASVFRFEDGTDMLKEFPRGRRELRGTVPRGTLLHMTVKARSPTARPFVATVYGLLV